MPIRLDQIRHTAIVAGSLAAALWLAARPMLERSRSPAWREGRSGASALAVRRGLALVELSGAPAERGRQLGGLAGDQACDLLGIMGMNPLATFRAARVAGCIRAISADDRSEIEALAAATGLAPRQLLKANATIETMCSVAVRVAPGGSPVVARNMDFFPPQVLGPTTMVQVVRQPGRRSYAAVTWPGMVGVISGMNDAGLTACILLNWRGDRMPPGEPLPLRVRRMLQTCASVDEAVAVLASAPTGSSHYVLLADRAGAALAWWTAAGVHVDRPRDGWLVATNLPRTAAGAPVPDDVRGCALTAAIAGLAGAEPDRAWFRRAVTASYMLGENAQAMVFDPVARRLELAVQRDEHPAALEPWRTVDLGAILDGAAIETAVVGGEPPAVPLPHYLLGTTGP